MRDTSVFNKEVLDFVNNEQDNDVVAAYFVKQFRETNSDEVGAYFCHDCFKAKQFIAHVGGKELAVNGCQGMHGGRERVIKQFREYLNASQKDRAYSIGVRVYEILVFGHVIPFSGRACLAGVREKIASQMS